MLEDAGLEVRKEAVELRFMGMSALFGLVGRYPSLRVVRLQDKILHCGLREQKSRQIPNSSWM